MVVRIRRWLKEGMGVRIVTARVNERHPGDSTHHIARIRQAIQDWCVEHIGVALPVTCRKDYNMLELWDDRARQVVPNVGLTLPEMMVVLSEGADVEEAVKEAVQEQEERLRQWPKNFD